MDRQVRTAFLILIFVLITKIIYCQTLLYPPLSSDFITDFVFVNNEEAIIVNEGGSIFKSYDSGDSWELIEHNQGISYKEISFINNLEGYIFSAWPDNKILTSTNGGEVWEIHDTHITDAITFQPLKDLAILKSTYNGQIMRLNNFDSVWDTTYQIPMIYDTIGTIIDYHPIGHIIDFTILPSNAILALGIYDELFDAEDSLSFILKSNDEGLTWDIIWEDLDSFADDFEFSDDNNGWICSDKNIFHSFDGGYTWTPDELPPLDHEVKQLFTVGNSNIFGLTYGGSYGQRLLTSFDSGNTWSLNIINNVRGTFKMSFNNSFTGFLYGDDLFKTSDYGSTWADINNSLDDLLFDVDFVNPNKGFAVGYNNIYMTEDKGNSWDIVDFPDGRLEMIDEQIGYAGLDQHLFKTTDGGTNWTEVFYSENIIYSRGLLFLNSDIGIIHGNYEVDSSGIESYSNYITYNGGNSWHKNTFDFSLKDQTFDEVQILDLNHIYGINRNGFWLSRDTMQTWTCLYDPEYHFMGTYDFYVYDSNYCVLLTSGSIGHISTDGGETWIEFPREVQNQVYDCILYGIPFYSNYIVYEAGSGGNLVQYRFNPEGDFVSSQVLSSFTKKNLYNIELFLEEGFANYWFVGSGFTVVYTQDDVNTVDIREMEKPTGDFYLSNNFPNPFNPATTIRYSVPQKSMVELIIFDILGNVVETLYKGSRESGIYEVKLDGSNFSSGVYFYQLRTDRFTDTKKFVLIK